MRYLLDTNICTHIQADHPAVLACLARLSPAAKLCTSVVAEAEMLHGAYRRAELRRSRLLRGIGAFLQTMAEVLPITRAVADRYARLRARLQRQGTPLPANDIWIAAIALEGDLILVTDDAHFGRVPRLTVENWLR